MQICNVRPDRYKAIEYTGTQESREEIEKEFGIVLVSLAERPDEYLWPAAYSGKHVKPGMVFVSHENLFRWNHVEAVDEFAPYWETPRVISREHFLAQYVESK